MEIRSPMIISSNENYTYVVKLGQCFLQSFNDNLFRAAGQG